MTPTKHFSISVDSCVDRFISYLNDNDIAYIKLKRYTGNIESADMYNSYQEFDNFYTELKNGALPTTSQLNPHEVLEHFSKIFANQGEGDIIHLSLSSGLSNTYESCKIAADEASKALGRNAHIFDTLSASLGIAMLLDRLIELRDQGATVEQALSELSYLRDHQQVWASVSNLFHLRRGGRISGVKATIGSILNVHPILIINPKGKLLIQSRIKGAKKSIAYLTHKLNQVEYCGNIDYNNPNVKKRIYIMHSSAPKDFQLLRDTLKKQYPHHEIVEGMIGAIIGTHVGSGALALIFEGAPRLDV